MQTVAAAGVIAIAFWAGVIPASSVHGWINLPKIKCGPLCLPMFVLMFLQRDMYTGRAHHAQAH